MAGAFPFRAVIFDMDGVIVDTEAFYWRELRAFSDALGLGITDEELDRQVGPSSQAFVRSLVAALARGGRGGVRRLEPRLPLRLRGAPQPRRP